jgi:hypothetical protein
VAERCEQLWATPGLDNPPFIPSQPILGVQSVRLFARPDRNHQG